MANPRLQEIAPRTPPPSQGAISLVSTPSGARSAIARDQSPANLISPPTSPRLTKRKRVNRIIRPEPGSLYDILHENQGEALFTTPIHWQDQHVYLLGVQWNHLDTVRRPVPELNSMASNYPSQPTEVATCLINDLTTVLNADNRAPKAAALKKVLSTLFPDTLSKAQSDLGMDISFGNAVFQDCVRVPLMWNRYNSQTLNSNFGELRNWCDRMPVLGFINRHRLHQERDNLYRPRLGQEKHANVPGDRLGKLLRKRLKPKNADEDSYVVAAMLAVAQRQCSNSPPRSSPRSLPHSCPLPQPGFWDIPVKIITQDHHKAEFIIYSAVVTAAFLNRFAFPSKAPVVTDIQGRGLKINITRVQIWPLLGLKERLAKALGPEIAGDSASHDIADSDIETWGTDKERALRLENPKRKKTTVGEPLAVDPARGLFTSAP